MKKEFDWSKFKTEDIAVNCKTEEESKDFIKQCIKHGITEWSNGDKLDINNNCWTLYKEKTCYGYRLEYYGLCYGYKEYYKNHNYKILEWKDYINKSKEELNIIEVYQRYPVGSVFNVIINGEICTNTMTMYLDENYADKSLDDGKYLDWTNKPKEEYCKMLGGLINSKFILLSLPPKEVSFKDAIEHYSKGGNIKSILYSIEKTYVGLKTDNTQKRGLISDRGINITVYEILNAKWYIVE